MKLITQKIIVASALIASQQIALAGGPEYPNGFGPKIATGITFTENKGQVHDQNYKARPDVLFIGTDGQLTVHLKNNGVSYQLYRVDSWKKNNLLTGHKNKNQEAVNLPDRSTIYRLDLNWVNTNKQTQIQKGSPLEGFNNYYSETCPNGALNVKSYTDVTYTNLYNGINLKWYQKNGELEYDYIVAPNADYKQIQLQINGAEKLSVNTNGDLIIKTPLGEITEKAPYVTQAGRPLQANWKINNNVLSFDIKNVNPALELIIDPVVRLWGTYYGGSSQDNGIATATDASGNVYLSGFTASSTSTIIATSGAHQTTFAGGSRDAFLVKFNSAGVRQWGTYYGGAGDDASSACATSNTGDIYLIGKTTSTAAIASASAHQTVQAGFDDSFIVKFDASGVRQWGTYYGGNGYDNPYSCCVDPTGNIYIAGETDTPSGTAIATAGAHQASVTASYDAFLVKFNSSGVRQWGTYYGGGSDDYGYGCTTDASGNVYVTGWTDSGTSTLIATAGAHQPSYGGGNSEAFLVKFNGTGVRQWGTFYGGSDDDYANSCATDASGNVYILGDTKSTASISTSGAHQSAFGGGTNTDVFLIKFNSAGVRQWGTYYGGSGNDYSIFVRASSTGALFISGYTGSTNSSIITTPNGFQTTYGGGTYDAFIAKFNTSGVRISGSFYGGSSTDFGSGCCSDDAGNVYLVGSTTSTAGIASAGAHQTSFGTGLNSDAFLVKLTDCNVLMNPTAAVNSTVCTGAALNFTATITGTNTPTYNWSGPNSYTSNIQNPTIANAGTVNIGVYTLTVNNVGCVETATSQVATVSPCTGLQALNNEASNFSIYPNPNNGVFTIETSTATNISVVDVLGKTIYAAKLNDGKTQINISNFVSGVYIVKAENNGQVKTVRIVKQ